MVQKEIQNHEEFDKYFMEAPEDMPWTELDLIETTDERIPYDLLDTAEAETAFKNHINGLKQQQRRLE